MRRFLTLLAVMAALCGTASAQKDEAKQEGLQKGDAAPAFSLPGTDGKTYTLEDLVGERAVVIAWFPKAFTGG